MSKVASRESVVAYLTKFYDVSKPYAYTLVDTYGHLLEQGIRIGSFAYFVGDEIAEAENLELLDYDEGDEDDEGK